MSAPKKYLAIDEEGFPLFGELRVTDPKVGAEILENLHFINGDAFATKLQDEFYFVEAFDEPLVAQQIFRPEQSHDLWRLLLPYHVEYFFDLKDLSLDEWDRFHGYATLTNHNDPAAPRIPFVLSRKAQAEFFQLLDEYDDDSVTFAGQRFEIRPWLTPVPAAAQDVENNQRWDKAYIEGDAGWELNQPSPILQDMLPRLKLAKSRILVLGCGSGNDAAYFAKQGHNVTAVDFSREALNRAKEKFSVYKNIRWIESDVFALGPEFSSQFDLIFEHTCFCAINPEKRNDLIKVWRRCLNDQGQLMAVFFVKDGKNQAPFGGSEWEIRERLKKHFQFLFWSRWQNSVERRRGKELFVFAQKRAIE